MSKYTKTKIHRTFEGENKRREKPLPPQEPERNLRGCVVCQKPLVMSAGQIVFFHKGCRPGRLNVKRYRKQMKKREHKS